MRPNSNVRSFRRTTLLLFIGVLVGGATALAARSSQQNNGEKNKKPKKTRQMIEAESKLPVAVYDAPEADDPRERQRRIARGEKYEKADLVIDPTADVVTSNAHWAEGLSAIPSDMSDVVVVGTVERVKAYTTHSRTRVYSEFIVRVNEVLKDGGDKSITVNGGLDVDRLGGRVQFPNGKVGQYCIVGQGMPQVGRQYLLFLKRSGGKGDYSLLTGYEFLDGLIRLLDNPGYGHPITMRDGSDVASFLSEVRASSLNR